VQLPSLADNRLYLFFFGPGVGELVAVRAPPNDWLVVDGCAAGSVDYGPQLLQHYRAQPAVMLLSHPHLDHAKGVASVVDSATSGRAKNLWPKLGMVLPPETGTDEADDDLVRFYARGKARQAIAAIAGRWEEHVGCRWEPRPGEEINLGEAALTVLSPEQGAAAGARMRLAERKPIDWNLLATALLVQWRSWAVLLGSDLETPGWSAVQKRFGGIPEHHVLKIPHHGSPNATPTALIRATRGVRASVVTPYSTHDLPPLGEGGTIDRLQSLGHQVYLTALARPYHDQSDTPVVATRKELAERTDMTFDGRPVEFPDCFVAAELPGDGGAPVWHFGPGSVQVTAPGLIRAKPKKKRRRRR
jgi:beta-lactamase superfamily II metal-dependent hydrolase